MKKFKILALLLTVAISTFSMTGCLTGSNENNSDNNANTSDIVDKEYNDNPDSVNNSVQIPPVEEKPITPPVDNTEDKTPDNVQTPPVEEKPATPPADVLGYADVGERYYAVTKPIYYAAKYILNDLIVNGKVTFKDPSVNPRITSVRYTYGNSLIINYEYDLYVKDTDIKSEFITQEIGVKIDNFTEPYCELYNEYRNFLRTERKYEKSEKYEEVVLPLAENIAKKFIDRYEEHKDEFEIETLNRPKKIIIKANSSVNELHSKLIEKMNETILKVDDAYFNYYYLPEGEHYPLLTDQDIEISFGGENYKYTKIYITVNFQNFGYQFYSMPFNENEEFSKEYLNYMQGSPEIGYSGSDNYNPTNEEFLEFFEKLHLLNIELPLGYSGKPNNYFNTLCGEDTWLNFN